MTYSEYLLRKKLYNKRHGFNFCFVTFPFICGKIPAAPAYGVYISQLIQYSRACVIFQDFLDRGLLLTRKLVKQGFLVVRLRPPFWKFYSCHHDLVEHHGISVAHMTMNMFHLFYSYILSFFQDLSPIWITELAKIVGPDRQNNGRSN